MFLFSDITVVNKTDKMFLYNVIPTEGRRTSRVEESLLDFSTTFATLTSLEMTEIGTLNNLCLK
jgi:hypothetical protein